MRAAPDMARGVVLLLGIATAGCAQRELVEIVVPEVPNARSMILVVEGARGQTTARAFNVDEPFSLRVLELSETHRMTTLAYERTLDRFGITAGELALVPPTEGTPFPEADAIFGASVDADGVASQWEPATSLSPELAALNIMVSETVGCPTFSTDLLEVPQLNGKTVSVLYPVDDERLLGLSRDAPLFFVRPNDPEPIEFIGTSTSPVFVSAARRGDELWLGGTDGQLWRMPMTDLRREAATLVAVAPVPDVLQFIDVSLEGEPLEVLALARAGGVLRFDGTDWHDLLRLGQVIDAGGFLRLSNESVLFSAGFWPLPRIGRIRGNVATLENLPIAEDCRVPAVGPIVRSTGLGVTVGLECGALMHEVDGDWVQIANVPVAERFEFLRPYSDGVMYGDGRGNFGVVAPDGRVCPGPPTANGGVETIAKVGGKYVIAGHQSNRSANHVITVAALREPAN